MVLGVDPASDGVFLVKGRVLRKRELRTKDRSSVWGWEVQVGTIGMRFGVRVTEPMFDQVEEGQNWSFTGPLEEFNQRVQLVASKIEVLKNGSR